MTTTAAVNPPSLPVRRRRRWPAVAVGLLTLAVLALGAFQPWRLLTDVEVREADPFAAAPAAPVDRDPDPDPVIVGRGHFRSIGHATSGHATLGRAADGSAALFLRDLRTDNGPALRVYLSRSPADGDARRFGEDPLDLGDLKGNLGDQVYPVAAGADLGQYRSVVIWCERFGVAFGAAPLG